MSALSCNAFHIIHNTSDAVVEWQERECSTRCSRARSPSIRYKSHRRYLSLSNTTFYTPFGRLRYSAITCRQTPRVSTSYEDKNSADEAPDEELEVDTAYENQPAPWMARCGLNKAFKLLLGSPSKSSWQATFQTSNIRSLVFSAAKSIFPGLLSSLTYYEQFVPSYSEIFHSVRRGISEDRGIFSQQEKHHHMMFPHFDTIIYRSRFRRFKI